MIRLETSFPSRPASSTSRGRSHGFTLIELVVVVILLGILAALAVPKFIDLGRNARLASLDTLAAVLTSTAIDVHAMCKINPQCDYANGNLGITIGGRVAGLNYGWLDAGDILNNDQIDAWVDHDGFTATIPSHDRTVFTLDGAPDPVNCSVTYFDAVNRPPTYDFAVAVTRTGC